MMALYPSRANLDGWTKLGNKGWGFDELAPYFRKSGTVHAPGASTRDICGMTYHDDSVRGDGPVAVTFGEGFGEMNTSWMGTFDKLGLKMTADPRSGKAIGAFQNGATIDPETKTRSFAQPAYLTPEVLKRENLAVVTNTLVLKVLLETGDDGEAVATGILTKGADGTEKAFKASREVVVSCGAMQSPQILELSGVGDKKLLESVGIPVVVDNPNVGEHMQDHPIVCQSFEVNPDVPSGDVMRDPNVVNALVQIYQQGQQGPMGQSTISVAYTPLADIDGLVSKQAKETMLDDAQAKVDAGQRLPSTDKETELLRELVLADDEPAIQYILFPFQVTVDADPASTMTSHLVPSQPENYISIMSILNHPFSRGSCHITSADAQVKPDWDPNYNAHPADLEMLARSVQFVERIRTTAPFSGTFKEGGQRMPQTVGDTLDNAREVVRQRQISVFHPCSSCAMLPRELGGVVDDRLRVYGTRGLRVVDASVFPLEPLGNIQTLVYAVAEKAADMIKADRK